jgi:delta24-sterol reductase
MHVVQDIIIPISEMKTAVNRFHEWFEVYPLLVYPIRIYDHGKFQGLLKKPKNMRDGNNWEMYFDLGVYGVPALVKKGKFWDAEKNVRAMEAYTRDVLGYSCPYADLFMNREEFEQMFDHSLYRQVRKKYGAADAFPEIFDKVKRQV